MGVRDEVSIEEEVSEKIGAIPDRDRPERGGRQVPKRYKSASVFW